MKLTAQTAAASSATPANPKPAHVPFLLRILTRIIVADGRYRAKQKLKDLPDERLADIGLTRRDVDMAFSRQSRSH